MGTDPVTYRICVVGSSHPYVKNVDVVADAMTRFGTIGPGNCIDVESSRIFIEATVDHGETGYKIWGTYERL
jgi:hypothetical protein